MKKLFLTLFALFVCHVCFSVVAYASPVTLQWDANTESDLVGYKVYFKNSLESGEPYDGTGIYLNDAAVDSPVDVGNVTEITFELPSGSYTFVVTAYDTEGLESNYSNEVWTNFNPATVKNLRIIQIVVGSEW